MVDLHGHLTDFNWVNRNVLAAILLIFAVCGAVWGVLLWTLVKLI